MFPSPVEESRERFGPPSLSPPGQIQRQMSLAATEEHSGFDQVQAWPSAGCETSYFAINTS